MLRLFLARPLVIFTLTELRASEAANYNQIVSRLRPLTPFLKNRNTDEMLNIQEPRWKRQGPLITTLKYPCHA